MQLLTRLANAARSASETYVSPRRVISDAIPSASNNRSIRRATSRVRSFSSTPPHIAPESWPPWPGSRTTTAKGLGVVGGCVVLALVVAPCFGIRCIQIKEAIINNKPDRASMRRIAGFIRDLWANISLHILIANQRAHTGPVRLVVDDCLLHLDA